MLYKPVETLNKNIYNKKTDIYALGVVFYKLCYFDFPYEILNKVDQKNENEGTYELKEKIIEKKFNYSKDLNDLIKNMINLNENERYDVEKIYNCVKAKCSEDKVENIFVESVIRCFSSFGSITHKNFPNKLKIVQDNLPIIFNLYNASKYFVEEEEEGSKIKNKYVNFLNNLGNLFVQNINFKKGEKSKLYDFVNFLTETFLKEIDKAQFNEDQDNLKQIKGNMERYFIGRLKRINEAKYLFFNIIKMNPDTLEKSKNNGKYEIGKLIFQNNFNYIFGNDYKYINIPRYIMLFIDREKSHNNTSGKSFEKKRGI